jgi:hypothetical protein
MTEEAQSQRRLEKSSSLVDEAASTKLIGTSADEDVWRVEPRRWLTIFRNVEHSH